MAPPVYKGPPRRRSIVQPDERTKAVRDFRDELWKYIQGTIPPMVPATEGPWPGGQGSIPAGSMGGGTFPTYPPSGPTSGPMTGIPRAGSPGGMVGAGMNMLNAADQAVHARDMNRSLEGRLGLYGAAIGNMPPDYSRWPDREAIGPHIRQRVQGNIDSSLQDLLNQAEAMRQNYQGLVPHQPPDPSSIPPHWQPPQPPVYQYPSQYNEPPPGSVFPITGYDIDRTPPRPPYVHPSPPLGSTPGRSTLPLRP